MKLAEYNVVTTIAVKDLEKGKEFYREVLGLKVAETMPAGVRFTSGKTELFIYQSETAGTGQATCANWNVENISEIVSELKEKGVTFETYEVPGAQKEGDVMVIGKTKATWFKDPDGNVLGLTQIDRD